MSKKHDLQVGDLVKFRGNHPWKGHTGKYVGDVKTILGMRAKFAVSDAAGRETVARKVDWVRV